MLHGLSKWQKHSFQSKGVWERNGQDLNIPLKGHISNDIKSPIKPYLLKFPPPINRSILGTNHLLRGLWGNILDSNVNKWQYSFKFQRWGGGTSMDCADYHASIQASQHASTLRHSP